MKILVILTAILIAANFYLSETYAQCSDAGICQLFSDVEIENQPGSWFALAELCQSDQARS